MIPGDVAMGADRLISALRDIGTTLSPETEAASIALFAPLHKLSHDEVVVALDLSYGPDARQKLDIYTREGEQNLPVLLFVHGGGFVGGDKWLSGTPFYRNFGEWAARRGFVGAVMNYRLAPADPWPAGPEDVGRAIAWLRDNIVPFGGCSQSIILMAQSAGAAHAAAFVAHTRFHGIDGPGIAGAVLISGIYDVEALGCNPLTEPYYGQDPTLLADRSAVPAIGDTDVPLLLVVGDIEDALFERQTFSVVAAMMSAQGRMPDVVRMHGHSHLSQAFAIGLDFYREFETSLDLFIRRCLSESQSRNVRP